MLRRRLPAPILLACYLLCRATLIDAADLQTGKTQEGMLQNGRGATYTIMLNAGDCVQVDFDLRGVELIMTVYDPVGMKFRAFRLDPDYGNGVLFLAEAPGTYRLQVDGAERSKAGSYGITLTRVIPVDERLEPPPFSERYESASLSKLKADLSAGKADAVAAFWKEAAAKTTPLLETIKSDSRYVLTTFLWQGDESTRNVVVQWFPYVRAWPEDYRMIHLAGTNVWYKTFKVHRQARFVYRLAPNASYLRPSRERDSARIRLFTASGQIDPMNPRRWLHYPDNPDAAKYQDWSAVEMPDAPLQPWADPRPGVPAGVFEEHQFTSHILQNERDLGVYLPPGYAGSGSRQPYPLVVLFDGAAYAPLKGMFPFIPGPTTLDNLIADKRIPPAVLLVIDHPPGLRNLELACNAKFLESLNTEIIPWVRSHYNVTHDPAATVVGGLSLGGFSATCAALYYPRTFGNVLSQSAGFFRTPVAGDDPLALDPEADPNWLAQQFIARPRLQVRFFLTVGTDEFDPAGRGQDGLTSNRHLRDVLLAKGYEVHYQEYHGGHDFLSWRGSLADGLIALLSAERNPDH